jgi:4-hydroxy-2-oxoheptanedioate aldolase
MGIVSRNVYGRFASLKGEFEAEGLTREEVASEALFAARHGLDYLVKIGGCEAKSDIVYLQQIGVTSLVAPMVETPFAMSKYMDMLPPEVFHHIGVTIETFTAVENIDAILDMGKLLTDVTIGRSDLTASFGGSGVECSGTIERVKITARAAKARGLKVTMGGSVSARTRDYLQTDSELRGLLDFIETRKAVIAIDSFVKPGALEAAIEAELDLLRLRSVVLTRRGAEAKGRVEKMLERL